MKHSPYPSGPSAPRISHRSLWSSLQCDSTALSLGLRSASCPQQGRANRSRKSPRKCAQSNRTRTRNDEPPLASWASTRGARQQAGERQERGVACSPRAPGGQGCGWQAGRHLLAQSLLCTPALLSAKKRLKCRDSLVLLFFFLLLC